jgi:hypothetical protein
MSSPVTHVDAHALAEFRAGLVTGRRGARIAAHLAGCDRCAALDRDLAGVSALLASVPVPALPDHVARRLDTALAAEVTRRNDPERAGREPSPESGAPVRRAAHRGFRLPSLRVLAPIAGAAAVVLAVGGYGLSLIAQGPAHQATASSAGSAQSVAGGANPAVNRAAAPMISGRSGASIRQSTGMTVVPIGTNFQATGLQQQLETALKAVKVVVPAAGAREQTSARVQACVRNVAGSADVVRLLSAHYRGQPVTIIVTRAGPHYTAWVAGPDCSGTNRDLLAHTSLPSGI